MGSVYRVDDPRLARKVAIKVHQGNDDQTTLQRFTLEAQTTGRLEHPSIPPVYEYGEADDGSPYFALKLLEGQTLAELLEKLRQGDPQAHSVYDFPARYQIAIKLCEALEYAHLEGVIHRDIKPENILLGRFGEVWLVDWGVAGPPTEENTEAQEETDRLTKEPTFMGTLEYAAPEQLAGVYNALSDQYSLGAVLYELFSLKPAHPGKTRLEFLTSVTQATPEPAEKGRMPVQGRVPREVSVLLSKMLSKKPEERFSNLQEVIVELKRMAGGDIPVLCPHTFTKKGLFRLGKLLDNHNYWLMPLLILWLLYPLYDLFSWLSARLFP